MCGYGANPSRNFLKTLLDTFGDTIWTVTNTRPEGAYVNVLNLTHESRKTCCHERIAKTLSVMTRKRPLLRRSTSISCKSTKRKNCRGCASSAPERGFSADLRLRALFPSVHQKESGGHLLQEFENASGARPTPTFAHNRRSIV